MIALSGPASNLSSLVVNKLLTNYAPITVSGSVGATYVSVSAGSLPVGLNVQLASSTVINFYGTPSAIGTYPFTLKVQDNNGPVYLSYTFTVASSMLAADSQHLALDTLLELYELDTSPIDGGSIHYYFYAGVVNSQAVVWQGNTYTPWPILVTGFEVDGRGKAPRPRLQVSNRDRMVTTLNLSLQDLIGAKIIRRRTYYRYLDAVNFTGNVNPTADATAHYPDDLYFVEQKIKEDKNSVEYELAGVYDLTNLLLPLRKINSDYCSWTYKGVECGYIRPVYFTAYDAPTTDVNADACGKRLSSCRLRFSIAGESLPFGGFPGAGKYAI
jgi:lambda family phage minor tail protein L